MRMTGEDVFERVVLAVLTSLLVTTYLEREGLSLFKLYEITMAAVFIGIVVFLLFGFVFDIAPRIFGNRYFLSAVVILILLWVLWRLIGLPRT